VKIAPAVTAMPAEPATWAMFRNSEPPPAAIRRVNAPQANRITSGLTPGLMPALRPAIVSVPESTVVSATPKTRGAVVGVGRSACMRAG
jgi:hypothetical protein